MNKILSILFLKMLVGVVIAYQCADPTYEESNNMVRSYIGSQTYDDIQIYSVWTSPSTMNYYMMGTINYNTLSTLLVLRDDHFKVYEGEPSRYSFEVSPDESYLFYVLESTTNFYIVSIDANDGSLNNTVEYGGCVPIPENTVIRISPTNDAIFFVSYCDSGKYCTSVAMIGGPAFTDVISNSGGTTSIMVVIDNLYVILTAFVSGNDNFLIFANNGTTVAQEWITQIVCPSQPCHYEFSDAVLSNNEEQLYSVIDYDGNFIFFAVNTSDGANYGSRYLAHKSSNLNDRIRGISLKNNIIAIAIYSSRSIIGIYDITGDTFDYIKYDNTGAIMCSIALYDNDKLLIVGDTTNGNGYYDITAHDSLQPSLYYEDEVSFIFSLTTTSYTVSATVASPNSLTVSGISLATNPTDFVLPNQISRIYISAWNNEQTLDINENSVLEVDFDFTCSIEATTMTYTLEQNGLDLVPDWVTLDTTLGKLIFNQTPSYSLETYTFIIETSWGFGRESAETVIYLNIIECPISGCYRCSGDNLLCEICDEGYELNKNMVKCDKIPFKETPWTHLIFTQTALAIAVALDLTISIISLTSPHTAFSMINQFQLFLLLPMLGAYMPPKIIGFIIGMDFTMLSFDFIPIDQIPYLKYTTEYIKYDQKDEYLVEIGLESASTIINMSQLLLIWTTIGILHLLYTCCFKGGKCGRRQKWYSKLSKIVFNYLTLGAYIQFVIESFLFMLISTVSEINAMQTSNRGQKASLFISCALSLLLLLFLICSLLVGCSTYQKKDIKYANSFIEGIDPTLSSRLFYFSMLLHRVLLVIVAVATNKISFSERLVHFVIICVTYLIYFGAVRPFDLVKNNLVEFINQFIYIVVATSLCHYNIESRWSDPHTTLTLYVMMSGCLISLSITVLDLLVKLAKKINKSSSKKQDNLTSKVHPKSTTPTNDIDVTNQSDVKFVNEEVKVPMSKLAQKSSYKQNETLPKHNEKEEFRPSKNLAQFKRETDIELPNKFKRDYPSIHLGRFRRDRDIDSF